MLQLKGIEISIGGRVKFRVAISKAINFSPFAVEGWPGIGFLNNNDIGRIAYLTPRPLKHNLEIIRSADGKSVCVGVKLVNIRRILPLMIVGVIDLIDGHIFGVTRFGLEHLPLPVSRGIILCRLAGLFFPQGIFQRRL